MSLPPEITVSMAMQPLADQIDKILEEIAGERMGFSLVVFNTKPGSRMNYVSNCDREEVINALSSLLDGWEQGMPDIPAHKVS
jgi:hypothetical protein